LLVFGFIGYPEGLCGLLSGLVALKGLARGALGVILDNLKILVSFGELNFFKLGGGHTLPK